MPEQRHFTTRRGFVAALGFGAVSLYGVWAAFGAAPFPFGGPHETVRPPAGHGGAPAMTPETFRIEHDFFVRKSAQSGGGASSHIPDHAPPDHGHGGAAGAADVYLLASRFAYSPDLLHLKAGVPYRFRLMADDVTHGASIQLGSASRIIRLRPNIVTEQTITFIRPGTYLVYCTVYCGPAHDAMQGRITVT